MILSRAPALGPPFARADNPLVGYYRRPESSELRRCIISGTSIDVHIVSLHNDGEPLLNKRLEAYIAHLTELGIYVTVSPNCSLLSDERSHRLIKAGLRMVGTDFCADPALYERLPVRGVWFT